MFPEDRLSTTLVAGDYTYPYTLIPPNKKTAYALGGIALADASQGLNVQLWTATALQDRVVVEAPSVPVPIVLLAQPDISELTLAFDQNMNYALAYFQYGQAKLYWYDSFLGTYTTDEFAGIISPRITMDDRRDSQTGNSDMIFGYCLDGNLYFRRQRDRFLNQYLLQEDVNGRLEQMGMNVHNRLQFKIKPFRTS